MRKQFFYPCSMLECTDSILPYTVQTECPHLSVKIQNLKSQNLLLKLLMTSFLRKLFFFSANYRLMQIRIQPFSVVMQMPSSIQISTDCKCQAQSEFNSQKQNKVSRLLCAQKASHRPSKFQNLKLLLPNYLMT